MSPSGKRKLKLTIDGKAYVVEIGNLAESPLQVTVNGQDYQVEIEGGEQPASTSLEPATTSPPTSGVVPPPVKRKKSITPIGASSNEVQAPMPGDILDIMVKPGDRVSVGDQICSLEAMKMKSAIRAARDGVIASVEVSEGQAVAHGDVLVTFK